MAYINLRKIYSCWDKATRREAVDVLVEWLGSDNVRKRFDAIALIDEFEIADARSGLENLAIILRTQINPEAKHELQRVTEVLQRL